MSKTQTVHLLHFEPPYRHARHYCGSCKGKTREAVEKRLAEHLAGQGSPLVRAAAEAAESGCEVTISRILPGDRNRERQIKKAGGLAQYCPTCREQKRAGLLAEIEVYEQSPERVEVAPGVQLVRVDYPRYRVEVDGARVADVERAEKIKGRVGYLWRGTNFAFRLAAPDLIRAKYDSPEQAAREIARDAREVMCPAAAPVDDERDPTREPFDLFDDDERRELLANAPPESSPDFDYDDLPF